MNSSKRGWETRRLYAFEANVLAVEYPFLQKRRTRGIMRGSLVDIWSEHSDRPAPTLAFGPGIAYNGERYSYCVGKGSQAVILLTAPQQNFMTLVHEIVHALGHGYHNASFVSCLFNVLAWNYGSISRGDLVLLANTWGIRV